MDFCKYFNDIENRFLLLKSQNLQNKGVPFEFFKSYFSDGKHCVGIKQISETNDVKHFRPHIRIVKCKVCQESNVRPIYTISLLY